MAVQVGSGYKHAMRVHPLVTLLALAVTACHSTGRAVVEHAQPRLAASSQPVCPGGIDATFVQIQANELEFGRKEWTAALGQLRSIGIATIVLQYSGDERGPFDGRASRRKPVESLLSAADAYGMGVYLGLYFEPSWPETFDVSTASAPPLDDPAASAWLAGLCRTHRACVGFYIPEEIDDRTWGHRNNPDELRHFLERSAAKLRELLPARPIAAAPFYTGHLSPQEHAAFWSALLQNRPLDALMLQDGLGVGRATIETASAALSALGPALDSVNVELWTVLELFHQLHGPPHDDLPFAAESGAFPNILAALSEERRYVRKTAAFAVLNYMNTDGDAGARTLHAQYRQWCETQRSWQAVSRTGR